MKSIKTILTTGLIALLLLSCNNTPSLQKYYVENQENQDFMVVDIPTSILNIAVDSLTEKQQKAYKSIEKLNVLAFKKTDSNAVTYTSERQKIKSILADDAYKTLITYGGNTQGAVIKYSGEDTAINEVIIFGADDTQGFGIVRVLGNDMNPAQLLDLIEVVKKSKPDTDALKELANFF